VENRRRGFSSTFADCSGDEHSEMPMIAHTHSHATRTGCSGSSPWEPSKLFLVAPHRNSLEKCTCAQLNKD